VSETIKVDIWSDVQCPWCYIGKRKFERAVADFDGEVDVEYHSFELSPDTPLDFSGSPTDYLMRKKGLPREQVDAMQARVTAIAASVGLDYDLEHAKQVNTVRAHQLIHYAKDRGKQLEAKERLLKAYFIESLHLGDLEVLADLGAELGFDRDDVLRSLREEEYVGAVRADVAQAAAYGIHGVPFFVIDGKYGVSGAQESATFLDVLNTVKAEQADA